MSFSSKEDALYFRLQRVRDRLERAGSKTSRSEAQALRDEETDLLEQIKELEH